MCSAASSLSFLFLSTKARSPLQRNNSPIFNPPRPFLCFLRPSISRRQISAAIAQNNLGLSWVSPNENPSDNFGGWAFVECPVPQRRKRAFPSYVVVGIGTSLVVLAAVIASFSLSRKGFKIQFGGPLQVLHGILSPLKVRGDQIKTAESDTSNEKDLMSEVTEETVPISITETATSAVDKPERVIIPLSVDSTQEEALSLLKLLKIIEDDVEAHELCTRREFARWLVKLNSFLERNLKRRIAPVVTISGSLVTAFDDIRVEDPDFAAIQALAEAGVIPSKLSSNSWFNAGGFEGQENMKFFPDRFISRQDLVDWRAQFEYEFSPEVLDQISTKKVSFMDVKEIGSHVSPALYVDMLAGDRSLLRKVFGQSKRFQPNKPSTKAQAAVALTSGSVKEAIFSELSRIESENSARQAEAEEIRSELLGRGDIQKFWDEKFNEEKFRGSEVEKHYHAALKNLEEEKVNLDRTYADYLKEKAAMDCQRQLLLSVKEEVDEISETLSSERVTYLDEKHVVQQSLKDLESKHEEMLDKKSTLEAEKEALQIMRWQDDV
ncbi:uncharacterized protein LOC129311306 isoform X2 [Prosopis cineraria]|uniref:uncharacterized protein LOC129311306 isoform X2 n=1 Tax=Prosopis cineraria TaxID=364024 RepID=UPI00241009BA|nr:uncharacterized protein LOC129311306 isoform X2 [Prosopis cineraria]XP_054809503.1 uncharacterized protein LOC129311306 isoform X2 [Prosopis cineraria]